MPDDLERLDEDLAGGRVDASTYRRRRDALLAAEAAEAPPTRPATTSPAGPSAVPSKWR